jgi:aldehyde:ferredoxin oxidoreductase
VAALIAEEQWRQVLSSLVVCFFSRGLYTPDAIVRALAAAGVSVIPEDLDRIGAETLRRKWAFKRREGFDPARLRIPERVCETETPLGRVDADALRRALEHFAALSS